MLNRRSEALPDAVREFLTSLMRSALFTKANYIIMNNSLDSGTDCSSAGFPIPTSLATVPGSTFSIRITPTQPLLRSVALACAPRAPSPSGACEKESEKGATPKGFGAARHARWTRKRSEEHTSELQSRLHLVCRLLLEKKKEPMRHDYKRISPRVTITASDVIS